jgi:hypothetical protein
LLRIAFFQLLRVAAVKIAVFWNVIICNLVGDYWCFGETYKPAFSGAKNTLGY